VRPVPGGTESAGTTWIPERLPGFRKAPVPDPLRKTESPLQSGQLHYHPTRTDGRITASLCPARDGMRPRGPSRLPPRQPTCRRRKIDRIHPLDREKIQKNRPRGRDGAYRMLESAFQQFTLSMLPAPARRFPRGCRRWELPPLEKPSSYYPSPPSFPQKPPRHAPSGILPGPPSRSYRR
jgi:hypothetical protein